MYLHYTCNSPGPTASAPHAASIGQMGSESSPSCAETSEGCSQQTKSAPVVRLGRLALRAILSHCLLNEATLSHGEMLPSGQHDNDLQRFSMSWSCGYRLSRRFRACERSTCAATP